MTLKYFINIDSEMERKIPQNNNKVFHGKSKTLSIKVTRTTVKPIL